MLTQIEISLSLSYEEAYQEGLLSWEEGEESRLLTVSKFFFSSSQTD